MRRNISGGDRLASRREPLRRSSGRNPRPNTSRPLQPGIHRYLRDTDHAHVYLASSCSLLSLSSSLGHLLTSIYSIHPRPLSGSYVYISSDDDAVDPALSLRTSELDSRRETVEGSDIAARISAFGIHTRKVQRLRNIHVCTRIYHRAYLYAATAKCITVGTTRITLPLCLSLSLSVPLSLSLSLCLSPSLIETRLTEVREGTSRRIRGGRGTRNGSPFTSDTTRFVSRFF